MGVRINWLQRHAAHMLENHALTPAHAQEAVDDIDAVWFDPDPTSKSGISARIIGYSHSVGEVLCVILIPAEEGREGWDGLNAWAANAQYRRIYLEGAS